VRNDDEYGERKQQCGEDEIELTTCHQANQQRARDAAR